MGARWKGSRAGVKETTRRLEAERRPPRSPALASYPPRPWPEIQSRALALVTAFSEPGLASVHHDLFRETVADPDEAAATIEVLTLFAQRLVTRCSARLGVPAAQLRSELAEEFVWLEEPHNEEIT